MGAAVPGDQLRGGESQSAYSVLTTGALVMGVGREDTCGCCPRCSPEALRWALSRPCCSVGLDFGGWSSILLNGTGQPLPLGVRVIPEIGEQDEEDGAIHPDEVDDERVLVVAAGHEVVLADVQ